MTGSLADRVRDAVGSVSDPELRRPLSELDMVRGVEETPGGVRVEIALTIVGCPAADRIERDVRAAAEGVAGAGRAEIAVGVMSPAERKALTDRLRPAKRNPFGAGSLTRVIAVTSGKGGVGKSTVTANLAVALAQRGLAVGLVDADVHGFSIPGLLGLAEADGSSPSPTQVGELILPPVAHGVKVISIGMFLRQSDGSNPGAVMWRGPMLHRTLEQFLTEVFFGDLDVLLLDMPPGTGDIAISAGHLLPGADVLVVTTPQPAASDVAIRSGLVARQVKQNVVGVVENMAPLALPDGTTLDLFGSGGGQTVSDALSEGSDPVPLLASIPLSPALRTDGDAGTPVVVAHPDDAGARAITALAERIATRPRGLAGRSLPFQAL
ncbi:Mrp/NBP35 family ATP-binding protein [Microbacterium indicum]|uniref:Mrp/NBP35 family ATP-binding protein n=1 Tax=Microbacterium indicum TaxID=358100 RepID=UPI0003F919F6|nr:Mrp/NBP35 family ATP-binding protein [Microbacterium indicum]